MPRKPPYIVFTQPLPTKGQYKVYSVATSESLGMIKGDNSKRYWEAFDNDGKFLQSAERKKQLMDFFREIDKKSRMGEGGGIGFEKLSNKVAKNYEGKKVAPKYQHEYGKTYSKLEAREVGDKVAGKVYWQQQGRKFGNGGGIEDTHMRISKAIFLAYGNIDDAVEFKDYYPTSGVAPYRLVLSAVQRGWITPEEINKDVLNSAYETSSETEDAEEIGSSDMNHYVWSMLRDAGFDMKVENGRYIRVDKMAKGGEVGKIGVTYFIGTPEVQKIGRFNTRLAVWETCVVDENGNKIYGERSIKFSAGSAKNLKLDGIKITKKEFDKLVFDKKLAKGGSILNEYEQEEFDKWKEDGNVSKNADGSYSTQDAGFRNRLKNLTELKKYFKKEFFSDSHYANGGSVEDYRAKAIERQRKEEEGKDFAPYRAFAYEDSYQFADFKTDDFHKAVKWAKETLEAQRVYRKNSENLWAIVDEFTPIEKRNNVIYAYSEAGRFGEEDTKKMKFKNGGNTTFYHDQAKKTLGEHLYNHIASLNKEQLENHLSHLQKEIERMKANDTEYTKQEFLPKYKQEEKFILYLLERLDEYKYADGGNVEEPQEYYRVFRNNAGKDVAVKIVKDPIFGKFNYYVDGTLRGTFDTFAQARQEVNYENFDMYKGGGKVLYSLDQIEYDIKYRDENGKTYSETFETKDDALKEIYRLEKLGYKIISRTRSFKDDGTFNGYFAKGGGVGEKNDKWKNFVINNKSWFNDESEDVGDNEILLTTRKNGDVGNEQWGREDVNEAKEIVKKIISKFPKTQYKIEQVDEYVYLYLKPSKTERELQEEKEAKKKQTAKLSYEEQIINELGYSKEKTAQVVEKLSKYPKEYYEKYRDTKTDYNNAFRVLYTSKQEFNNIKFGNFKEVVDYITNPSFANGLFSKANPIIEVLISLYGWDCIRIKYNTNSFPYQADGETNYTAPRGKTLSIYPFITANIGSSKDLIDNLNKGISDFIKCYEIVVLETENKYAKGGGIEDEDFMSQVRTSAREGIDWEEELKNYAGSNYKSLTAKDKQEIIAEMKEKFDYHHSYARGGLVVTSIKDIPNFKEENEAGRITYRGLGMGKLSNDFYKLAGEGGTRIKVKGKEYFITDTEFNTFSRDKDGYMKVRFDAPRRRFATGGNFDSEFYKDGGKVGGYTLEDFNPLLDEYDKVVSYKKIGKLKINQIVGKSQVEDKFLFKTEKDRDYWYEVLSKEQEKYFTVKNKRRYLEYILENNDPYLDRPSTVKKSEMLEYYADEIYYELRDNTSRNDFMQNLGFKKRFDKGGNFDSEFYKDGGSVGKQKYAYVQAETSTGEKVFKFFEEVPTHKEVYAYFRSVKDENGNPITLKDTTIHVEEVTDFDRDLFLEKCNEVAISTFGSPIKELDDMMFSFDKNNLSVFKFEAELENGTEVSIQTVDGVIVMEAEEEDEDKFKDGGSIDINFSTDTDYIKRENIKLVKYKNGKELYNWDYWDSYNVPAEKDELFSGLYVAKKPLPTKESEKQYSMFKKGGKLPKGAIYIKRSDIDSVIIYDEKLGEEVEIPANRIVNGIWFDNERTQMIIDRAKKEGLIPDKTKKTTTFIARFNGKKIELEAKSMFDAEQKAIKELKVPKSKRGLLSIMSKESYERGDFQFN